MQQQNLSPHASISLSGPGIAACSSPSAQRPHELPLLLLLPVLWVCVWAESLT